MLLSPRQMQAVEERAFSGGVSADDLMEDVGEAMARAIRQFNPEPGVCAVFCGKGNNAGDALVAARHLAAAGWDVLLREAYPTEELGELPWQKLTALGRDVPRLDAGAPFFAPGRPFIVLDGLLGLGAKGELRSPIAEVCREINALRQKRHARVYALDMPTGLNGETGEKATDCVQADLTLTVAFAKKGLVADGATSHVGRLVVIPVKELDEEMRREPGDVSADEVVTTRELLALLPPRPFESHKGNYGRVGIVAGSPGFLGAAVLTATGALRAGAGLVTLFAPEKTYGHLAAITPPEVMVRPVASWQEVLDDSMDVLAVGPGWGADHAEHAQELLTRWPKPLVLDADGINSIAGCVEVLSDSPAPRLLTPHPGEMRRIFPQAAEQPSRGATVRAFTDKFPVTLLLKGARTVVGQAGSPLRFNTTGGPGLSTGGMGDVLTGAVAGLMAQGLSAYDAAALGAWLCGRAGEAALVNGFQSPQSLLPSDVLQFMGVAFEDLAKQVF